MYNKLISKYELECDQFYQEITSLEEQQEVLEYGLEGLIKISESIENTLKYNGVNVKSAQFIHLAVNGYIGRLGMSSIELIPSIESFNENYNQSITRISLENIKEKALRLWNKIKTIVSNIWESIKNFFSRWSKWIKEMLRVSNKQKNKIEKIKKGVRPKEEGLKVTIPSQLQYRGKLDLVSIIHGLNDNEKVSITMNERYLKEVKELITHVVEFVEDRKPDNLHPVFDSSINSATLIRIINNVLDRDLLGGKTLINDNITVKLIDIKNKLEEDKTIKVPTINQIDELRTTVHRLLNTNSNLEEGLNSFEKVKNLSINRIDNWFKRNVVSWATTKATKTLQRNFLKPVIDLARLNYMVSKATLRLIDDCLECYDLDDESD